MATSTLTNLLARCADLLRLRDSTTKALTMYCPNVIIVDSFEQLAVCKDDAVISPKACAKLMQNAAYELSNANAKILRLTDELLLRTKYCKLPWYKRMTMTYERFKEQQCCTRSSAMQ